MTTGTGQLLCDSDDVLRQRRGIKWSRAGPGQIPADFAELDFAVAAPVRHAVLESARLSDFGYPDFDHGTPVRLRELFAERMAVRHGWQVSPERVELSAQIVQALCCVLLALTQPGERVLVHAPTYPPFLTAIRDLGRRPVFLRIDDVADATASGASLPAECERIRLVILCHPHNPTGRVFSAAELDALATFADMHDAVVFSDEIYHDLVFAPATFRPAALTPGLGERMITFTSAAKSFNIPGLRCAVGYFGNTSLHDAYRALPWHLRDGASLVGIEATRAAWRCGDDWLAELRATLSGNRELIRGALHRLPGVAWTPPAAGFLAWLDFARSPLRADPRGEIERHAGVRLSAGDAFGPSYTGFARLNFGTSPERLARILDRIARVLDAKS